MSQHYNMQHPAVGGVHCPVCQAARGVPCSTTERAANYGQRTETHVGRVKFYERTDAGEGRAGSQEPGE